MKRLILAALVLSASASAQAVQAQSAPEGWGVMHTEEGCFYYEKPDTIDIQREGGWVFHWSGPCSPNQPISGSGTMAGEKPSGLRIGTTGRFVGGFRDGAHSKTSNDPDFSGRVLNYDMGCLASETPRACERGVAAPVPDA